MNGYTQRTTIFSEDESPSEFFKEIMARNAWFPEFLENNTPEKVVNMKVFDLIHDQYIGKIYKDVRLLSPEYFKSLLVSCLEEKAW